MKKIRLSYLIALIATFTLAAVAALFVANYSVTLIEENSEIGVRSALDDANLPWAEVEADGLQITLAGIAPTEAARLRATNTAGSIVDQARVIDLIEVEAQAAITPPDFSVLILRNGSGLSVNGLIPASTDRDATVAQFTRMAGDATVTDLLEVADYPAPAGWDEALAFGISAMEDLTLAKASITPERVKITAITESHKRKTAVEQSLNRRVPSNVTLALDVSAPRPVITPFTLRFQIDEAGARFDACSADTEESKALILQAATAAGATGDIRCTVGLGVPSPNWAKAVEKSIQTVAELGAGSVAFADADITLVAEAGTDQSTFDRAIGNLENALPEVFALDARLPKLADPNEGPSEFTATLSPEGQVQLRGRVGDAALRELATSYAKARFGSENVFTGTRIVEDLPAEWPNRVLTGLEALSALSNGALRVTADTLSLTGNTGNPDASTEISTLLAGKLGDGAAYDVDVTYQIKLDPVAGLPTPDECEAEIGKILEIGKIYFEPSSATIDASALGTMDDIAAVLKRCGDIQLEIQGHTDSQGRESMNLDLSQSRAESVLNELRARRVLTGSFTAKGYGEANPIADNKTEEGREANRRIEFKLIRPDTVALQEETTLESLTETSDTTPEEDSEEVTTDGRD